MFFGQKQGCAITVRSFSLAAILAMSCPLPLPLFAQEASVNPVAQKMKERREKLPDVGPSRSLSPRERIPDLPWETERPDTRLGQSPTTTEQQGHSGGVIAVVKVTVRDNDDAVKEDGDRTGLPEELLVQANYPNPFNNATRIVFHLPEQAQVYAEIFDILGRVVYTSQVQKVNAGWERTLWLDLPTTSSGMYMYRLNVTTASGTLTGTGRMIQIRR